MNDSYWLQGYENEINQAIISRNSGNEGRARVCARRAVGIVIGEYFAQHQVSEISQSAYDRIKKFVEHPDTPDDVKDVAGHFLVRVDTEHNLPLEADLIAEAQWLKNHLLEQEN